MIRLHLIGDGPVCDLLAELARYLDYDEVHRSDDAPAAVDADDHIVVCVTRPLRGRELLTRILASGEPAYLGLVAPEKEAFASLLKLSAERIPKARLDRISAPAGLPVGALTPGEHAVAIAAELVATRRRRPGGN